MNPRTFLATLAALLVTTPAPAQVVRGVVLEELGQAPIEGAMVLLLEPGGETVGRVLTDAAGGFLLKAPTVGAYRLRVDRIGFESVTTDPVHVPDDGTFEQVLVPIRAVLLRGLDVEGARRCEVRPEEGQATARVWEEVRKALQAAAWTTDSGVYRYTLVRVERLLDRDGGDILEEQRSFIDGRGQAPYVSLPPRELIDDGFVQAGSDGGTTYYAPDAEAFLSDPFLDTHCMRLTRSSDGLLGLAFEPVAGRRVPDIEGVLWLDPETATLRTLKFRYVHLADSRVIGEPGGEVVFGRLADGTWIVRAWSIRMPVLERVGRVRRVRRVAYRQEGGIVWRVVDRDGAMVVEATTATVGGSVVDSSGVAPLAGAAVRSVGTGERTWTGEDGGYLLAGLPAGDLLLAVDHPSLDTLGLAGPPATVTAPEGEVTTARLSLVSVAEAAAWSCGREAPVSGTTTLVGRVRAADGPATGARVRVSWLGERPFQPVAWSEPREPGSATGATWEVGKDDGVTWLETILGQRGTFLLCDVPVPGQLRVRVTPADGGEAVVRTVTVVPGAPVTPFRLTLTARGPAGAGP